MGNTRLAGAWAERAAKANKKAAEELASKGRCGDYAMKIRKSTWWRHYLNRQRGTDQKRLAGPFACFVPEPRCVTMAVTCCTCRL